MKNKARHAEWAILGGQSTAKSQVAIPTTLLRVLDLPGFREFEDYILLYSSTRGEPPHDVEERADELSLRTFGIRSEDTYLPEPEGAEYWLEDSGRWLEFQAASDKHDEKFQTVNASAEDAVEILLTFGIDFRDERGSPLKSTLLFCVQAESAVKGIAGKMPDKTVLDMKRLESKLAAEAQAHLSKKRQK